MARDPNQVIRAIKRGGKPDLGPARHCYREGSHRQRRRKRAPKVSRGIENTEVAEEEILFPIEQWRAQNRRVGPLRDEGRKFEADRVSASVQEASLATLRWRSERIHPGHQIIYSIERDEGQAGHGG